MKVKPPSLLSWLAVASFLLTSLPAAQAQAVSNDVDNDVNNAAPSSSSIQWGPLLWQAFEFDALENGFRVATQPETRATMGGPFFRGYARSLDNLHGWADGDPFFVNYVGHPLQGSVAAFLFVQNDPRFRKAEFGRNKLYWKSRLRATAFSWMYSEQFELGPLSEATIGHTQAYYPQQGFVDHVITPTIGLAWMLAEDSLDRYLITAIENHTENPWIKMWARSGLNPSRSLANMLRDERPWHRDTRGPIFRPSPPSLAASARLVEAQPAIAPASDGVDATPPFQIAMQYDFLNFSGRAGSTHACNGGDVIGQYQLNSRLALVANVGGCKLLSTEPNNTRDSTLYLAGTRVNLPRFRRWQPYLQILGGGNKLTSETVYPALKPPLAVIQSVQPWQTHSLYTDSSQTNSWALEFGGGTEYVMTSALAWNAFDVERLHTWTRPLGGQNYHDALRVSTGLILRFGTW